MQLDMRLVMAFSLVMRSGSLTQAEAVSGISKATLSRQLQVLEEELGVTLFNRRARGMTPTEAGRAFYTHCEQILADVSGRLELAREQLQELGSGISGELTIKADSEFSTTFAAHVTKLFMARHPNVKLNLDIADYPGCAKAEEIDGYICAELPDIPDLVGKLLGQIGYGLYASPSYLQKKGNPVTPMDLTHHDSIVIRSASGDKDGLMLHSQGGGQPYRPKANVTTNDPWIMKTFCIDGFGIALLPDFFVRPELTQELLVPVLPEWKPKPRRIYCAYQKQRFAGRKLRDLMTLMVDCVEDIDSCSGYVGRSSAGIG
ncbi:LysR family transcriptional regulator [Caballeronia concitans]|jgi:DNA-binding transcriptional LysR family regulator|uniref:LysR substrate binding domain protein n=1 Tax=Caballeronia concitans TaxID=1777133 RepID=A0A658R3A3_9BURK|nr:LysR family transcriptional regulator [Caballeronia concitans]KIG01655.1 transcriptional regulator, LysR family [Burkholderia sp. MR1]SAL46335.1 LysR substrate binding domain protein [Caballeronia concitans]